jgi:CBS domain-containing protein
MAVPPRTPERTNVDGFIRRPWSSIPVDQVMRARVLTCDGETPLREIARMMVTHAVHAVVVVDRDEDDGEFMTGTVSDQAVARAAAEGREPVARELAEQQTVTVSAGWRLDEAAREMLRRGTAVGAHVVVTDGRGAPIGMLSTLDVARIVAWGRA